MSRPSCGSRYRVWALIRALALLLIVLLATSCAGVLGGGSPTAPAIPDMPVITPIAPGREASPSPSAEPAEPQPADTAVPTADTEPDPSVAKVHTVQPGDTLLGVARMYDVPMAAIQLENDMGDSMVVKTGQELAIPPAEAWPEASAFWILHVVDPGETLLQIARDYDLDVEELRSVNGLDDADRIRVGQPLILPLGSPASPPAPAPTETPLPSPTTAPTATATAPESSLEDEPESTAVPTSLPPEAPSSDLQAPPPADLASWPAEIARLINEVRAQHGLPPFRYDETLEQAAQAHANDCAQRGWGSHTGSDGSNIKQRVMRAGYDGSGWAECWAQTQTPEKAIEVWMDETPPNDPHRRTLLSDWLTEIGIGVAHANYGHYIFADFGRP